MRVYTLLGVKVKNKNKKANKEEECIINCSTVIIVLCPNADEKLLNKIIWDHSVQHGQGEFLYNNLYFLCLHLLEVVIIFVHQWAIIE